MENSAPEQHSRRQGDTADPFLRTVVFLTPFRLIQLLSFLLVFSLCLIFSRTSFFQSIDNYFYDYFLKYQTPSKAYPAIVYIGIDKKSLRAMQPLPWPKRSYAEMTRILREWGAKAIVFDMFFTATQGADSEEENQALLREFQQTKNLYLPVLFESRGHRNYYVVQSDPLFNDLAQGIGHINYIRDPDNIVRRFYPFLEFNRTQVPHLGVLLAYDFLGRPVPTSPSDDFSRDVRRSSIIQWTKKWSHEGGYYSFSDILDNYELHARGQPALIKPEDIQGKICLIGLTVSDNLKTPSGQQSPRIAALGNVMDTALRAQSIRTPSWATKFSIGLLLGAVALFFFVPFRPLVSSGGALLLGFGWTFASFFFFLSRNVWLGMAMPLALVLSFFVLSYVLARTSEYRERAYFLNFALRDELTGLYAMRYMRTFLTHAMHYTRAFKQPFAVILIDLDDFRNINDAYGYQMGNTVLKKVADVIQSHVRTKGRALPDIPGRYGDEEFIVLLVGENLATAAFGIAERIRTAIEKTTFKAGSKTFSLTVSTGVSLLNPGEKNPHQVVERAQEALLRAKANGKNQTCLSND